MKRLREAVSTMAALTAVAFFAASGADARTKPIHHHGRGYLAPVAHRLIAFPTYIDHGSDRNPGGDNLYFTDTKDPKYLVGPGWFQRWGNN